MFCTNCGKEVADTLNFCPFCGTKLDREWQTLNGGTAPAAQQVPNQAKPQAQSQSAPQNNQAWQQALSQTAPQNNQAWQQAPSQAAPQNNQAWQQAPGQPQQPKKPASKKKIPLWIPIVGGSVLAVIVILIVVFVVLKPFGGGGSYKAEMNEAVKMINQRETDTDTLMDAIVPDFADKEFDDAIEILSDSKLASLLGIGDLDAELESQMRYAYDSLESEYGTDAKVSYEVIEEVELSSSELLTIQSELDSTAAEFSTISSVIGGYSLLLGGDYSAKLSTIVSNLGEAYEDANPQSGYRLHVEVTTEGSNKMDKQTEEVVVVKIDGKWTIYEASGMFDLFAAENVASMVY